MLFQLVTKRGKNSNVGILMIIFKNIVFRIPNNKKNKKFIIFREEIYNSVLCVCDRHGRYGGHCNHLLNGIPRVERRTWYNMYRTLYCFGWCREMCLSDVDEKHARTTRQASTVKQHAHARARERTKHYSFYFKSSSKIVTFRN